jgi:hypothetical protein
MTFMPDRAHRTPDFSIWHAARDVASVALLFALICGAISGFAGPIVEHARLLGASIGAVVGIVIELYLVKSSR